MSEVIEGLGGLAEALRARGVRRALVLTGPSRRFLERLAPLEGAGVALTVFDGAKAHVPEEAARAALAALSSSGAEAILSLGGGSAIGLGKALRLELGGRETGRERPFFVAIPTTYAGSERTSIYGIASVSEEGARQKRTGRDPGVRPDAIVHEPSLFLEMPKALTVTSLLNALAHPISALAEEAATKAALPEAVRSTARMAIRRLPWALLQVLEAPGSALARREALEGADLAAQVIDGAPLGPQHRAAHLLGGALDLPHAPLHALLLPRFVLALSTEAPALFEELREASGEADLPAFLFDALRRAEAPLSLRALGVREAELDALSAEHPELLRGWVREAFAGRRPSARGELSPALFGEAEGEAPRGFGNAHESEALPGALPPRQNSPRRAPYGLFPEQINASGFTAERHHNQRTWLYRIRPSAQHSPFAPSPHPRFGRGFEGQPVEINLVGHRPLPIPEAPTDFVDGLVTYGGAGRPELRRGYAVHLYAANRDMERRAFYNADGELLILPQEGAIALRTELGALEVRVGELAILPRGLKASVLLPEGRSRGYVAEVFGRRFELPDRGPAGANGLTEPRHFRAPKAAYEDRIVPGYRITAKLGGHLYEATQDFSPYDVVAWHGGCVPYVYDLRDFSPIGNTLFDHPDPSIYTVLSAPMDERGAHTLDLVFFPPRWDPTEGTFRPPYFHRNATTEINGILADPSLGPGGPFHPGGLFLTPSMTAHGVLARAVERALTRTDAQADRPARVPEGSMWFQLETSLPIALTPWAQQSETRIEGWPHAWGAYRSRFRPA